MNMLSIHMSFEGLADVQAALDAFLVLGAYDLAKHRSLPLLYQSGVYYRRDKCADTGCTYRYEDWTVPSLVYRVGFGDCKKLAVWRAAELRLRSKERARPVAYQVRPGLIHVVVRRGNGSIEDPSKILGME